MITETKYEEISGWIRSAQMDETGSHEAEVLKALSFILELLLSNSKVLLEDEHY